MLSLWSLSQSPVVNPTEHRTMNQELGRRQPRIPAIYGVEDVKRVELAVKVSQSDGWKNS